MPYVKTKNYRDLPFSVETHLGDFYAYYSLKDLVKICEDNKHEVLRCRTVGVLQSRHGQFVLKDVEPQIHATNAHIQVSVVYLKSKMPSLVMPHAVQLFGYLQWIEKPILFAKLLQPILQISTAIKLRTALDGITSMHLAKGSIELAKGSIEEDETAIKEPR